MPSLFEILSSSLGSLFKTPTYELPVQRRNALAESLSYGLWRDEKAPQAESNDYNLRAFYEALLKGDPVARSAVGNDEELHFPDKWKLPNHPTFSTESMYYDKASMPNTPTWNRAPMSQLPGQRNNFVLRRPDGSIVSVDTPWARYNALTNTYK